MTLFQAFLKALIWTGMGIWLGICWIFLTESIRDGTNLIIAIILAIGWSTIFIWLIN